jgi:uncharacterized protein YcaQ
LSIAQAKAWCTQQTKAGAIVPVRVNTVQGKAVQAWALPDITTRIARAQRNFAKAERTTRVLNPFDPILRDRARCAALFGFDYRFEAFTPAPKRTYGYYVLPVLHADRLVARFDPQLDRSAGTFSLAKLHWEPHIPASERKTLLPAVEEAIASYARFCGADHVTMPTKRRR